MAHSALKITGGVVQNETPALNEAGISQTQLIRLKPDPKGLTLPEKLGGWAKFYGVQVTQPVRALWGWQDTNSLKWLAFGTAGSPANLAAIQCTTSISTGLTTATNIAYSPPTPPYSFNVTPRYSTGNTTVNFSSIYGSSNVTIVDTLDTGITIYDNVYVVTPVSVGGVTISGLYQCFSPIAGNNSYVVVAQNVLNNPVAATYTTLPAGFNSFSYSSISSPLVTLNITWPANSQPVPGEFITLSGFSPTSWNGTFIITAVTGTSVTFSNSAVSSSYVTAGTISNNGVLPQFVTTSSSNVVTVNFPNHGLSVGSTFSVAAPTTVGGIPLFGNYVVSSVTPNGIYNSYQFTILANNSATSSATGLLNNGQVYFLYSYGAGPAQPAGYNQGLYGAYGYGIGQVINPSLGTTISATNWSLDNWGQQLIAVPVNFIFNNNSLYPAQFQPIFVFDPTVQQPIATAIPNSPVVNNGAFVAMPQRQIIAWGSSFTSVIDPLLIRWCDVNNYNTWAAQITNQAGSYRLPTGSQIVGAMQGPQQGLLWTDIALWAMQYIGPPYVYSFNQLAAGCGLIGRRAMGTINGVVYWMGNKQFFSLSGNGVTPIPCPIWDVVFQDLDLANVSKITCAVNSLFEEITWYYPIVGGSGEVTNYIRFNAQLNSWDFGTLARSAWLDTTVLGPPIGYDPANQYIYQHEISQDADGAAMSSNFTTGYFALSDGENKVFVDEFWPDMKWGYYGQSQSASVQITFNAVDFPGQTPVTYGPYTVTQSTTWFNPRIRARLLSITVSSSDLNSFWRLGNMRYRAIPDGRY